MTADDIREEWDVIDSQFGHIESNGRLDTAQFYQTKALWEIALQLAELNERYHYNNGAMTQLEVREQNAVSQRIAAEIKAESSQA